MRSIREDDAAAASAAGSKKKRRKDLSMMELIEQVKTHQSRALDPRQEAVKPGVQNKLPAPEWDSDSDTDMSDDIPVERPVRPTTACGRRRMSGGALVQASNSPHSDDAKRNPRPVKKSNRVTERDVGSRRGQGHSRNLPPLSRELDPARQGRDSPLSDYLLTRQSTVMESRFTRNTPLRSSDPQFSRPLPSDTTVTSDVFCLERQRTIILDKEPPGTIIDSD